MYQQIYHVWVFRSAAYYPFWWLFISKHSMTKLNQD